MTNVVFDVTLYLRYSVLTNLGCYLTNVGSLFLVPTRFTDFTLYSLSTLNLQQPKPRPAEAPFSRFGLAVDLVY